MIPEPCVAYMPHGTAHTVFAKRSVAAASLFCRTLVGLIRRPKVPREKRGGIWSHQELRHLVVLALFSWGFFNTTPSVHDVHVPPCIREEFRLAHNVQAMNDEPSTHPKREGGVGIAKLTLQ